MIVNADAGDPRGATSRGSAQDRSKAGSAFDAALGGAAKQGAPAKADNHRGGQAKAETPHGGPAKVADAAEATDEAAPQATADEAVALAEALAEGLAAPAVAVDAEADAGEAAGDDAAESEAALDAALAELLADPRAGEARSASPSAAAALLATAQAGGPGPARPPAGVPASASGGGSGLSPAMRLAKVLAASFGSSAAGDVQAPRDVKPGEDGAAAAAKAAGEPVLPAMPTDEAVPLAARPGAAVTKAADAATLRVAAALKPADAGIAAAKIDVVAMRTHFEPTRHDPVLVGERAGAASGEPGEGTDDGEKAAEALLSAIGGAKGAAASAVALGVGADGFASPASQIASAVASLVDPRDGQEATRGASAAGVLRYQAGGAALKSIRIQLQPEHLGKVDVSLRMVRGELAVEIATPLDATAAVLANDADGLKTLLRRAGFTLDDAAVTIVVRDLSVGGGPAGTADAGTSASGRDASSSAGQGGSADGRAGGGENASAGAGGRGERGRDNGSAIGEAAPDRSETAARAGGSLYL